jgi:23S rRNA (cytosine1962-C5)-methyltransferase
MTTATSNAEVRLKPRKAQPFFCRHPWVRETAIAALSGHPADGDVVDLVSDAGEWIARGIINTNSRIRVRLYTWDREESLDETFWRGRIEAALSLRKTLTYDDPAGACRLINSEADGLSGLIVDRYADHLVVQPTSLALGNRLEMIVGILDEHLSPRSISVHVDEATAKLECIEQQALLSIVEERAGKSTRLTEYVDIEEHGVKFRVPVIHGQKTGFYLDQRENRLAAAKLMAGRRVLDVCTYTGGFALAALKAGAAHAVGIDGSEAAIQLARENAGLNGIHNAEFQLADCFDDLARRVQANEQFDAVILDPPKFAAGRRNIDAALRAYHRMNSYAVQLLSPGGILVTCCCSGSVDTHDFFEMLFGVAQKSKRDIQVLAQRGASPDHPVSVTCRESGYLKCFICRVV